MEDKYKIITCKNKQCKQKLRLPRANKILHITCPTCKMEFNYLSGSFFYKIKFFIESKIKKHPFITGIILTVLTYNLSTKYKFNQLNLKVLLLYLLLCFVFWFIVVIVLDMDKDYNLKWYHESWLVFSSLFYITPLGIILLWITPRFNKTIKNILTILFCSLYIYNIITEKKIIDFRSNERMVLDIFESNKRNNDLIKATKKSKQQFVVNFNKKSEDNIHRKIQRNIKEITQLYNCCIVLIEARDRKDNIITQGSGFIITKDGGVVTNHHVIESAKKIIIRDAYGESYKQVSLIEDYPEYDIAILKIEDSIKYVKTVILGNSEISQIGEQVVAIGNPGGWQNTVSDGIISGKRELTKKLNIFQVSTPVSPGSSGGPIFNMYGEVIGIVTLGSYWELQNLNFAIPTNIVKQLILEIK